MILYLFIPRIQFHFLYEKNMTQRDHIKLKMQRNIDSDLKYFLNAFSKSKATYWN